MNIRSLVIAALCTTFLSACATPSPVGSFSLGKSTADRHLDVIGPLPGTLPSTAPDVINLILPANNSHCPVVVAVSGFDVDPQHHVLALGLTSAASVQVTQWLKAHPRATLGIEVGRPNSSPATVESFTGCGLATPVPATVNAGQLAISFATVAFAAPASKATSVSCSGASDDGKDKEKDEDKNKDKDKDEDKDNNRDGEKHPK